MQQEWFWTESVYSYFFRSFPSFSEVFINIDESANKILYNLPIRPSDESTISKLWFGKKFNSVEWVASAIRIML